MSYMQEQAKSWARRSYERGNDSYRPTYPDGRNGASFGERRGERAPVSSGYKRSLSPSPLTSRSGIRNPTLVSMFSRPAGVCGQHRNLRRLCRASLCPSQKDSWLERSQRPGFSKTRPGSTNVLPVTLLLSGTPTPAEASSSLAVSQ